MAKEIKEVTRVKHRARQSTYEVLGAAPMQVSEGVAQNRVGAIFGKKARQVVDGELLVVYRSETTGELYVRHPDEFTESRFEEVPPKEAPKEERVYLSSYHRIVKVLEETDVKVEDGGLSLVAEFQNREDEAMFVRLQSFDETKTHEQFRSFVGKRVRITIEALSDE